MNLNEIKKIKYLILLIILLCQNKERKVKVQISFVCIFVIRETKENDIQTREDIYELPLYDDLIYYKIYGD